MRHHRIGPRRVGIALAAAGLLAAMTFPAAVGAETPHPTGAASSSPADAGRPAPRINVKFADGATIRLRGNGLVSTGGLETRELAAVTADHGFTVRRMFPRPEPVLDAERARAESRSGRDLADKNLWYVLDPDEGTDTAALLADLRALPYVEHAYLAPIPQPPPVDHRGFQIYQEPAAADGIDVDYGWTIPGGRGEFVTIIDIEYSFNSSHEDLTGAAGALIPLNTPCDPLVDDNHGTAVMGILFADDDLTGVTGSVFEAEAGFVNANSCEYGYQLAEAIDLAHANLVAGDAILLEQQVYGSAGGWPITCDGDGGSQEGLMAVEWDPAFYDAIAAATADGINVVEAAGNGSCNLDEARFGTPFPSGRADSGAIIVGAGRAPATVGGFSPVHGRIPYSTYGSRVDVQGWGEAVMTTGYGDSSGSAPNQYYTHTFSGTSSASPLVTSAVAALSSIGQQQGVTLTPGQIRSALTRTGSPQDTSSVTGNIGPLPDIREALGAIPAAVTDDSYALASGGTLIAHSGWLTETEPNHPGGASTSQSIDGSFVLGFDPFVGDTQGNTSMTVPHATVVGTGDGTVDRFRFTVATAGAVGVFDVDGAATGGFDAYLRLLDAGGNELSSSDDEAASGGAGGDAFRSPDSSTTTNPLLVHSFASAGTYEIEVSRHGNGGGKVIPGGATYTLSVSLPDATPSSHPGVLGNDLRVLPPGGVATVKVVQPPAHGALSLDQYGGFTYTHDGSATATDSFTYSVRMPEGGKRVGTVTLSIPSCNGVPATIVGTSGDDQLLGTRGVDVISGLGGNDTLRGSAGDDLLCGDDGNDVLHGGVGDDQLFGGAGIDRTLGKPGNDVIYGGDGNDILNGNTDSDTIYGENGDDLINGGKGDDVLRGGSGNDRIFARPGDDTAYGNAGNDQVRGNFGNDELFGNAGDDTLRGGQGNDTLDGGADYDILLGGTGVDTCTRGERVRC